MPTRRGGQRGRHGDAPCLVGSTGVAERPAGIGIALLAYGLDLRAGVKATERPEIVLPAAGRSRVVAIALVTMVVVMSAFWTASRYALELGRGRAIELAMKLPSRPAVTVFTPHRLGLAATGVSEQRLPGADLAYRYRYSGLRLLVHGGGKYFLLPDRWIRGSGTAIVLSDKPEYRLEFGPG